MFPLRDAPESEVAPDAGRRERNKLRTRHELHAAAVRLFAERGYEATSVDDIVEEAGVSVRTFFRYFASKEDVLFARHMDVTGFLDDLARQPRGVPPVEAIRRAFLEQPPLTADEVRVHVLFHRAMGSSATLQGRYLEGLTLFREQLAATLARRARRRTPDESDVLAATIGQTVLDHAFTRWIGRGAPGDPHRWVDAAFGLLHTVVAP
ncbi:MAG: TetR family transcriptional regulator [Acidimicrobiia bacterium]|jgi:AcrR family transcriptional regulator